MTTRLRLRTKWKTGSLAAYSLSIVVVSFASLVRAPLQEALGEASPLLFYWPSVLLIAALFGLRPALLATGTAALQANYFWMLPQGAFGVDKTQALQLATFCFGGISLAWLSEIWRRERLRREQLRATLASAAEAILAVDSEGRVLLMNPSAQFLTGLGSENVLGQPLSDFLFLEGIQNGQSLNSTFHMGLMSEDTTRLPESFYLVGRSGGRHLVRPTISRLLDARGRSQGRVIILQRLQPCSRDEIAASALRTVAETC